jgi:hypothetical protein
MLSYRWLLLLPLLGAGGTGSAGCSDGFGPNCAKESKRCSLTLPSCCSGLFCSDAPSGPTCQPVSPQ